MNPASIQAPCCLPNIPKLKEDGSNFVQWRRLIQNAFELRDLTPYVEGTAIYEPIVRKKGKRYRLSDDNFERPLSDTEVQELLDSERNYKRGVAYAFEILFSSLSAPLVQEIVDEESVPAAWDCITQKFEPRQRSDNLFEPKLIAKLHQMTFEKGPMISAVIALLCAFSNAHVRFGDEPNDRLLAIELLRSVSRIPDYHEAAMAAVAEKLDAKAAMLAIMDTACSSAEGTPRGASKKKGRASKRE